jgi:hypothetical protein
MLLSKFRGTAKQELRFSYMVKAVIVGILVAAAIAFIACLWTSQTDVAGKSTCIFGKKYSTPDIFDEAGLEWAIAFGFVLYPLSFWLDLRRSLPRSGSGEGQRTGQEGRTSEDAYRTSIRTPRAEPQMSEA